MMGGMWGAKKGALKDIESSFNTWSFFNRRGADQEFLKYVIYPQAKSNYFIHSDLVKYKGEEVHPFPTKRQKGEYIGAAFDFRVAPKEIIDSESQAFTSAIMKTYRQPYSLFQKLRSRLIIEANHWYRLWI